MHLCLNRVPSGLVTSGCGMQNGLVVNTPEPAVTELTLAIGPFRMSILLVTRFVRYVIPVTIILYVLLLVVVPIKMVLLLTEPSMVKPAPCFVRNASWPLLMLVAMRAR